jgi:hypothetical protein
VPLIRSRLDWLWYEPSKSFWSLSRIGSVPHLPLDILARTYARILDGCQLLSASKGEYVSRSRSNHCFCFANTDLHLDVQACDYTLVVAGQDADHEDPEKQRHAIGSSLVRQVAGKVIVFHPKETTVPALEKDIEMKSEETVRRSQVPVAAFDPTNEAMREALRDGQATIIDLGLTSIQTDGNDAEEPGAIAANSAMYGGRGSAFSMRSVGQDNGAMLPPGTETSG